MAPVFSFATFADEGSPMLRFQAESLEVDLPVPEDLFRRPEPLTAGGR